MRLPRLAFARKVKTCLSSILSNIPCHMMVFGIHPPPNSSEWACEALVTVANYVTEHSETFTCEPRLQSRDDVKDAANKKILKETTVLVTSPVLTLPLLSLR